MNEILTASVGSLFALSANYNAGSSRATPATKMNGFMEQTEEEPQEVLEEEAKILPGSMTL